MLERTKFNAKIRNRGNYDFEKAVCIFLVSVGKENFEGEKLIAQLKIINKEFKKCVILVADTLQRYNIAAEGNKEDFTIYRARSKELGDLWVNTYRTAFEKNLTDISYEISFWDDWINDKNFILFENKINNYLEVNSEYQKALNESIEEYVSRGNRNKDIFYNFCRMYLIEECAVMLSLAEKGFDYILYPGNETNILKKTQTDLILEKYKGKLYWISVRLDKLKKTAYEVT